MDAPLATRRRAKALRRELTLPEGLLWRALKGRQLNGLHFRKQHPLGPYVLDFYCDALRLCVEVDGYAHGTGDRPERDQRRDAWLRKLEICTLRLSAGLVLGSLDDALSTILAETERCGPPPSRGAERRAPPPPAGEE